MFHPGFTIAATIVSVLAIAGGLYFCWSRLTVSGKLNRLKSGNADQREAAVEALLYGRHEVTNEQMVVGYLKALGSKSADARSNTARSLGELGDTRAVEPLIHSLGDEDKIVRRAATESLVELKDTRALGHLQELLSRTSESREVPDYGPDGEELGTHTERNPEPAAIEKAIRWIERANAR